MLFFFTELGKNPGDGMEFPDAEAALQAAADAALAIARDKRVRDFALSVSSDQGPVAEVIVRLEVKRA
jgi:hypothetical protein